MHQIQSSSKDNLIWTTSLRLCHVRQEFGFKNDLTPQRIYSFAGCFCSTDHSNRTVLTRKLGSVLFPSPSGSLYPSDCGFCHAFRGAHAAKLRSFVLRERITQMSRDYYLRSGWSAAKRARRECSKNCDPAFQAKHPSPTKKPCCGMVPLSRPVASRPGAVHKIRRNSKPRFTTKFRLRLKSWAKQHPSCGVSLATPSILQRNTSQRISLSLFAGNAKDCWDV